MTEVCTSRPGTTIRPALAAVVVLSLAAAALSGYMWVVSARLHASGAIGPLPICPETDLISCGEVLASPYSQWLGLPLAAGGTVTYVLLLAVGAGLLAAGRRADPRLWAAGLALAGLGTLSGLWLLVVQAFLLHRFCLLCDIVHVCGLVSLLLLLARRPAQVLPAWRTGAGAVAAAGATVLVLGQVLTKAPEVVAVPVIVKPPTARAAATSPASQTAAVATTTDPSATTQAAAGTQPSTGTQLIPSVRPANAFDITDAAGTVIATLDLDREIILGDPTAGRTLVEFMDFGCHECRDEYTLLQEVWQKHPHWFRMVVLLYPGNKECNPRTTRERPNVCEIAQAGLAVHRHSPGHYKDVHTMFFKLQTTPLTGGMAWNLAREMCQVDDATLQAWQDDPALAETIRRHCEIVHAILVSQKTKGTVGLPGLFANGRLITGLAPSLEQLEKHLTQLLGPPGGPAPTASQPAGTPAGTAR